MISLPRQTDQQHSSFLNLFQQTFDSRISDRNTNRIVVYLDDKQTSVIMGACNFGVSYFLFLSVLLILLPEDFFCLAEIRLSLTLK
jgi:hypothetical protein